MSERSTPVPPLAGWLMIVGGVALAGLTFVDWYEFFGVGVNAWQTLTRTDVAIFVAGIVAAACGAWLMFGDVGPERRVVAPFGALAAGLGAIVVFVRMVSPPADLPLKFGIYLALAAALAATVGGVIATLSTFGSPRPPSRPGPSRASTASGRRSAEPLGEPARDPGRARDHRHHRVDAERSREQAGVGYE